MGVAIHFTNPFDPAERETFIVKRPMTVRRLVSRHPALRRHTAVRRYGTGPGVPRSYRGRRVREFVEPTLLFVNGSVVLRDAWRGTLIGATDIVTIVNKPAGGGGGGGSNPLGIILAVAVVVAVAVLAPELAPLLATTLGTTLGTATAIASAGLSIAFGAIATGIMSLFAPPPGAGAGNAIAGYGGAAQSSPTYDLQAQGNTARLGQPIPVLHGRHRIFCDYVMPPYARYVDNEQYLSALLVCTQGEIEIEAVKIGDTPVSSFDSIEYEVVEPGAAVPTDKVDTRFIPCTDIADTELLDAAEESPWAGPFAANPPGTSINYLEVDDTAPRGLYKFNSGGGFDTLALDFDIEVQEIDDTGTALGDWTSIDSVEKTGATNTPQRWTLGYATPSAGRWQVRQRRTDTKDGAATAGHELHWVGLRGRLLASRRYAGMTLLAVKMKATGDLNGATSRLVNVIGTRKLPTWDPEANDGAGGMTTTVAATRSICDAFADTARNSIYGTDLRDDQVDLAGLYAHKATLDGLGWAFDYVWDTSTTGFDALSKIAMTALGVPVVQGGRLRLVRDVPTTAPVMMFTPRNIRKGSLGIEYKMVDEQTADSVLGTIVDPNSFKPVTLPIVAFPDSPQKNTSKLPLEGVTGYDHGWAILHYWIRSNRYRRRIVGWGTEMEGLLLLYGDPVSFSFDIPQWGQSAEIVAWDEDSRTATLTEPMAFTPGATHYMAVRAPDGTLTGPFEATAGAADDEIVLDDGELPEILTGGDRERTLVQFGPGQAYAKQLKVIAVQPRDQLTADILAIDDDPRMYDEVPPRPSAPIGTPTEDMTIAIENSDGPVVNLRSRADADAYSGLALQQVTFTVDEDVDVAIVRGSWPAGAVPIVELAGVFSGADGAAGAGGNGGTPVPAFSNPGNGAPGSSGGIGGTALDAASGPLTITGAGTIQGGKGGGGGGGGGGGFYYESTEPVGDGGSITVGHQVAGGNGGAGNGGAGGSGTSEGGFTAGSGGDGGAAGSYGGAGSTGSAGTAASGGAPSEGAGGAGGAGGAAGKAIVGYANLDLSGFTGTITGGTS